MEKKKDKVKTTKTSGSDFISRLWEESWTYIKTVVDIVHEPVLILDKDFRVLGANERFYQSFQVEPRDTENKIVYELGNGQWNIPSLKKLLEDILPKNSFFKGFEVTHDFPSIGRKMMILNARQIHLKEGITPRHIILLAIEDITEMMNVAETFASNANRIESEFFKRTKDMQLHIDKLEKDISYLKNKL